MDPRTMSMLEPYVPTTREPWDEARAAHLLRRAGFGPRRAEIAECVALGPRGAVEALLSFPDWREGDRELEREISDQGGVLTQLDDPDGLGHDVEKTVRTWWFFRMVRGRYPLQEKLVLFWHDHFACRAGDDIRGQRMFDQNQLFRRLADGSFRELCLAVAADPAMLEFLDGRLNSKTELNENFSRELLELFTLGEGNYTQSDVVEVARVFTGWTTPSKESGQFLFDPETHDAGDKRVFGELVRGRSGAEGQDEGRELIDRILRRPACARRLAGKLLRWFVEPEPADEVVGEMAAYLLRSDYSIRDALETLFRSRYFHDEARRFALFKTPVEFLVSAARMLDVQNPHHLDLGAHARRMGMELLRPPSVAGWGAPVSFLQSGYLVERYNFGLKLSSIAHTTRDVLGTPAVDFDRLASAADDADLVASIAGRLLHEALDEERKKILTEFLRREPDAENPRTPRERARALVHLVMTTPEFALA